MDQGLLSRRTGRADLWAIALGTTVAMWALGYVCRMPPVIVPGRILLIAMLACMLGGGVVAGRITGKGWTRGLWAGVLTAVLNMLILGSLLAGDGRNQLAASAAVWVPGSIALGAVLGGAGGLVGALTSRRPDRPVEWNNVIAWIAAAAALLLVGAGGMVTSKGAGLAVPDWPNTQGYNMFLYPLSRMTGGIYYEHTHRLLGTLVGLSAIVLAVHIWWSDRRTWLRRLVGLLVAMIIIQGVLGGLRVTGYLTLSTEAADMAPSIRLAIVHGVVGQICFALFGAVAVLTSRLWADRSAWANVHRSSTDRTLAVATVVAILVQLTLGAVLRHVNQGLHIHITTGVLVALLAGALGVRAWGLSPVRTVRRLGVVVLILIALQLALGLGAAIAVGAMVFENPRPPAEVSLATAHQLTGALVLVAATMLMLWTLRANGRRSTDGTEPLYSGSDSN